jgi:hypothetical protein
MVGELSFTKPELQHLRRICDTNPNIALSIENKIDFY